MNNMDYLEILNRHFKLEFDLRENFRRSFVNICESHGAYNGQVQLAKDLAEFIYDNRDSDTFSIEKDTMEDYENVFFNKLTIYYSDTENGSWYDNKAVYDDSDKIMNEVVIHINSNEYSSYNSILSCITHELTHAWDDYNSYIKGSKYTLYDLTNKDSTYYKLLHNNEYSMENVCKTVLNVISKIEQNAYLSELNVSLYKSNAIIHNYQDAVEHIKKDDVFERYTILFDFVNNLNGLDLKEFTNVYNNINNSKYTETQVKKKLLSQFEKIFKKISVRLPKIYADYVENKEMESIRKNEGLIHYNKNLVEYIKESLMKHDKKESRIQRIHIIRN